MVDYDPILVAMIHVPVGQAKNIRNVAAGRLNKMGVLVSLRQQQITSGYVFAPFGRSRKLRSAVEQLCISSIRLTSGNNVFNTVIR